jgi:crotonobetainyl-CoA:carnitine CoA-transferase CaiB-like acyl-CoA transferase
VLSCYGQYQTRGEEEVVDVLEGLKVVDITAWAFVPSAGGVLAHWGADVIKVESPTAPDPMRTFGGTLEPGGASTFFKHYSRGKRSVALNVAQDGGRDPVRAMCRRRRVPRQLSSGRPS